MIKKNKITITDDDALKLINKLSFFDQIENIEVIKHGFSGAQSFCVTNKGIKYFIKFRSTISETFENNFEIFKKCLIPQVLEKGVINGIQYYITEYLDCKDLSFTSPLYNNEEIYNFGKIVGNEQFFIAKDKKYDKPKEYFENFEKYIDEYLVLVNTILKENKTFIDKESYELLLEFSEKISKEKVELFNTLQKDVLYYCHNDIKMGNFLIKDNKVYTIDYEDSDFVYLAYSLHADYYNVIENKPINKKNFIFLKGFLDGFYNCKIPKNFSKELKLTFYMSLSARIISRLREKNYQKLTQIAHCLKENINEFGSLEKLFDFTKNKESYIKELMRKEIL